MPTGGCHCGAIRYTMQGEPVHNALCHCSDCRRHAGAPMVGWAMVPTGQVTIQGEPTVYASSEHGRRHFCGRCGTGLFYVNEKMLPGMIDVQTGTLDDPAALPPQVHIQVAERIAWMEDAHTLPRFERYPG
ncbi:aldehyde-activating protein [Methylobacterium sp. Leaf456]|uniref:GFA family protein n=1 Tax=Methylobacterium sp. Leaf456 TaxID=1736382 RepID=UPI0006F6B0B9|nr:GFA family protein [Methylobacterium sp. Leaf456]KQT49183.1 aldehyde-activating protein [Methylobacterium sp. Leaf456]